MHFCEIFGLSKLLTGQENGSQKGITGREFVSQISLPHGNLALKYHYRTEIWLSNIITGQKFDNALYKIENFNFCEIFWALKIAY